MNYERWGEQRSIEVANYAVDVWNTIQLNPVEVFFLSREASAVVLVAYDSTQSPSQIQGLAGVQTSRNLMLLGVYSHPNPDVVDTDIQVGDRFIIDDVEYEILDMIKQFGAIQARCQMRT